MALVQPVRLQLKRTKGFNLQELSQETNGLPAKSVARPHKWGNPFVVGELPPFVFSFAGKRMFFEETIPLVLSTRPFAITFDEWDSMVHKPMTLENSLMLYNSLLIAGTMVGYFKRRDQFKELRGCNLACYCDLEQPCHADVLLEVLRETA